MQLASLTMVYRSYDMLRRWVAHYGALVGRENLYVVSHGDDPGHRDIAQGCNLIGIPHTGTGAFERKRNFALNNLMRFLETYHDAVLRTDVDEFLFVDPEKHASIGDALQSTDSDAWFAVGFNIFAEPGDAPVEERDKVSNVRSLCAISDLYSKGVAVRNGVFLGFHGARDFQMKDASRMTLPEGLYLAHLKFAETREVDGSIAGETTAFPTTDKHGQRILREVSGLPEADAETILAEAYAQFSNGLGNWKRNKPHLFVVPRHSPKSTFRLPQRFRGLF